MVKIKVGRIFRRYDIQQEHLVSGSFKNEQKVFHSLGHTFTEGYVK